MFSMYLTFPANYTDNAYKILLIFLKSYLDLHS